MERVYKTMKVTGAGCIAAGVVILVTGLVVGRHYFHCQWSAAFKTQIRN